LKIAFLRYAHRDLSRVNTSIFGCVSKRETEPSHRSREKYQFGACAGIKGKTDGLTVDCGLHPKPILSLRATSQKAKCKDDGQEPEKRATK
jgi:hypothetical protein